MRSQLLPKFLSGITFLFILLGSNQLTEAQSPKSLLRTPEPGTYIDPVAKLILSQANKAMQSNPDSIFLMYQKYFSLFEAPVHKTVDSVVGSNQVPIRVYYPEQSENDSLLPVMILIHGGAFIWGSIETYDMLARKLTHSLNCIVVSVGYRLAPEFPYPAAINDCYSVLNWVAEHGKNLGGNPTKIGVIGDSAGGNLATELTLKARDENGPKISCQVLYYPSTDMSDSVYPSRNYFMGSYGQYYLLNEKLLRTVRNDYLHGQSEFLPQVSPVFANLSADLPPALIITAQCDPLRDEGNRYAGQLTKAGVKVVHSEYEGMIHGFVSFYPVLTQGRKAIRQTRKFVRTYLFNS